MQVIEEEKLQENADKVGTHMLLSLSNLMKEFSEIIGDVRGKGLMIGVELVSNVETREALPADDVNKIFEYVKDMGVLLGKGGVGGNVITKK